jgi:outer membrane protein assembly factor BamB
MHALQGGIRSARSATLVGALAALLLAAACSKDKNIDEPAKLTPLTSPTLRVQRMWSSSAVDNRKAAKLRLGLGISQFDNRIFAAGHGGDVVALDAKNGRVLWRTKTRAPLAGGTAASAGLVLVGASDGQLFALNPANGQVLWKVRLNGEVLAPAAIGDKLLAIRTVDGKLHGLSPQDGHELWQQEQQMPRLSLRGTASPVIVGDVVLCGFDNGKVLAVNASDGSVQWEATVTPPHGRTELERLADIDSPVSVNGKDVYAIGFQGRVAMLAIDTGQIWWSHEASSYRGLSLDDDTLYVADANGEVAALKGRTGAEIWRQKSLQYRGLSALGIMDTSLVTADFQGYVHWIDKATGALIARDRPGKTRISSQPLVAGNMVYVVNDRGDVSAYRVMAIPGALPKVILEPPAPPPSKADKKAKAAAAAEAAKPPQGQQ